MKCLRLASIVLLVTWASAATRSNPFPSAGIVPDEVTAVRVAVAILEPIFGSEEVKKFEPYHAQLRNGIWTVYGTLKRGSMGGTPQLTIQKKDGRVREVFHSQ